MSISPALEWLIAGVILLIVEVFTSTFVILWIGVAALVAGLVQYLYPSPTVPWIVFVVASGLLLWFTRPIARKVREKNPTATNVDALINQYAVVIETIDPRSNTGRVRVGSDEWRARSDQVIETGSWVRVVRITGATLIVEP